MKDINKLSLLLSLASAMSVTSAHDPYTPYDLNPRPKGMTPEEKRKREEELRAEYELIKQKKSKLSRAKRDFIVKKFENEQDQDNVQPDETGK